MKQIILVLILITNLCLASTWERISIGGEDLLVLNEAYDLYDSKGVSARFYHEDEKEDLHHLLTLVLEDKTGGCLGKSIQKGTFKIKENKLILYHLWDRSPSQKDAPFGASIEVYEMEKGVLKRLFNKIYIESHILKKDDKSGMKYLFTQPQTPAQEEKLKTYKKEIEKQYKGEFVPKEPLLSQVQKALQPKKHSVWKEYYK